MKGGGALNTGNWISAPGGQNYKDVATGAIKKYDDNIFSRLDTMHERDRETDGGTPDDSKDRAYAQRRALKL